MKKLALILGLFFSCAAWGQTAKDYFKSGYDKMYKGDRKGAIKDLDKAIELDTTYIDAYHLRAGLKYALQDYKGAIKDDDKIIELFPSEVYNNRGNAKRKSGDIQGACADFKIANELGYKEAKGELILYCNYTPKTAEEFYYRAEQGNGVNWKAKIEDLNKAIQLNPKYIAAYYLRATGKYQLGDKDEACLDWKKVLELADENDGVRKMNNNFCK